MGLFAAISCRLYYDGFGLGRIGTAGTVRLLVAVFGFVFLR